MVPEVIRCLIGCGILFSGEINILGCVYLCVGEQERTWVCVREFGCMWDRFWCGRKVEKYHVECACEALQHHLCVHLFANVLSPLHRNGHTCIISPFRVTEPVTMMWTVEISKSKMYSMFSGMFLFWELCMREVQAFVCEWKILVIQVFEYLSNWTCTSWRCFIAHPLLLGDADRDYSTNPVTLLYYYRTGMQVCFTMKKDFPDF